MSGFGGLPKGPMGTDPLKPWELARKLTGKDDGSDRDKPTDEKSRAWTPGEIEEMRRKKMMMEKPMGSTILDGGGTPMKPKPYD